MTKLPFRRNTVMFLVLAVGILASGTSAQGQASFNAASPDTAHEQDHMLGMILTGSAVGTVGFLSGAAIGVSLNDDNNEYAGLEAALIYGSIAGGLTLPLGVHVGNKSQGNLAHVMATSLAVGGAGWLVVWQSHSDAVLPVIPLVQLICCIAVESATTPDNPTSERAETQPTSPFFVNLAPTRDGMGFFISGSF